MRRGVVALLLAALVAASLTGCNAAQATSRPVTLDVVMADDWASAPVVREVVRQFERDRDVRVQIQAAPFSQIPDLVRNAIDLGEPFDLAHWHAFAAAADDIAEPLDDLWRSAGLSAGDYLPGAVEDVTWGGRRYGVPLDVNALVLLVNAEVLELAGFGPEDLSTAEGFAETAAALVDGGHVDHAITLSASIWTAYGWIRAFGGSLVDIDESGEPRFSFDDERTVAAIDMLGRVAVDGTGTPPFAPDLALDAVQSLLGGTVAMHASGSWDLPVKRGARPAEDQGDIIVLPMPRGDGDTGTVLGGSSLFVPLGATQRELAFDFALALTEREPGVRLAGEEGRLPARVDLYADPSFDRSPELEAFVDELPRARVMPLIAFPELAGSFGAALERVLKGQEDAATAMRELQVLAEEDGPR